MPVPQSTEATLDNQSLASLECLSQSNFQAHAQHAQHLRKSIGGEVRQDKDAAALPDPSSDIDADSGSDFDKAKWQSV